MQVILVQTCEEQIQETFDVRFSPDGDLLLSSDGNAIYLWRHLDYRIWEFHRSISVFAVHPRFAPSGEQLVFRDREQLLHILSLEGKELASLPYSHQTNAPCVFSPDQRWLVSSDTLGKLVIWDTSNYQIHVVSHQLAFHAPWEATQWTPSFQYMLDISRSSAKHFLFTPDGQRLAFVSASNEGYVHICQFHPLQQHIVLQKTIPLVGVEDQKISPDGSMIAITSQGSVSVYDLESFQLQARWSGKGEALYSLVAFSPDGQFLASSTYDGNVDILSLTTGERVISFAAHPGLITHWGPVIGGLDWSQSGYIATGGTSVFKDDASKNDYTIKLWDVKY